MVCIVTLHSCRSNFSQFSVFSPFFASFLGYHRMALVMTANERRALLIAAKCAQAMQVVARLRVSLRIVKEKVRAESRAAERLKAKGEVKAKSRTVVKKTKKGMAKMKKGIVRTKAGNGPRGRPALYAGECVACVYRATGRAGGPKHFGPGCLVSKK